MAEYDNRNTFAIFRNTRKQKDNHPDWNGTFTDENGVEYWLNAWTKTPKNGGDKFLSGSIKRKDAKSEAPPRQKTTSELDDEVPF